VVERKEDAKAKLPCLAVSERDSSQSQVRWAYPIEQITQGEEGGSKKYEKMDADKRICTDTKIIGAGSCGRIRTSMVGTGSRERKNGKGFIAKNWIQRDLYDLISFFKFRWKGERTPFN